MSKFIKTAVILGGRCTVGHVTKKIQKTVKIPKYCLANVAFFYIPQLFVECKMFYINRGRQIYRPKVEILFSGCSVIGVATGRIRGRVPPIWMAVA